MNDEHVILTCGLATLISDARDASDAYYCQIIEFPDDTDPLDLHPKKTTGLTPAELERYAVWNGYCDAIRCAITLDRNQPDERRICEALDHVADIEMRSSVRETGTPSFVAPTREAVVTLCEVFRIP